MMKRSDLTEFEIEEKDLKLRICRQGGGSGTNPAAQGLQAHPAYGLPAAAITPAAVPATGNGGTENANRGKDEKESGFSYITSPMVGTFYRAASPDSEPFVEEGKKVTSETVVCIIEAMKVMNEIQAENTGTIVEVLVENGDPVEYNQPLFKLKAN